MPVARRGAGRGSVGSSSGSGGRRIVGCPSVGRTGRRGTPGRSPRSLGGSPVDRLDRQGDRVAGRLPPSRSADSSARGRFDRLRGSGGSGRVGRASSDGGEGGPSSGDRPDPESDRHGEYSDGKRQGVGRWRERRRSPVGPAPRWAATTPGGRDGGAVIPGIASIGRDSGRAAAGRAGAFGAGEAAGFGLLSGFGLAAGCGAEPCRPWAARATAAPGQAGPGRRPGPRARRTDTATAPSPSRAWTSRALVSIRVTTRGDRNTSTRTSARRDGEASDYFRDDPMFRPSDCDSWRSPLERARDHRVEWMDLRGTGDRLSSPGDRIMSVGGEGGHLHPVPTRRRGFHYFFYDKHHGWAGPEAARWAST